jgi:hypothetical protein
MKFLIMEFYPVSFDFILGSDILHPPHPPLTDHPNIWQGVQTMKFLIMEFYPVSFDFILGSDILLSTTLFENTLNLYSFTLIQNKRHGGDISTM